MCSVSQSTRSMRHVSFQASKRIPFPIRHANQNRRLLLTTECTGHSNVFKNSVKIRCGELIFNYFIKCRPIHISTSPTLPPPEDRQTAVDRRHTDSEQTDGEIQRRVCIYTCFVGQHGLHTELAAHSQSAKRTHVVCV